MIWKYNSFLLKYVIRLNFVFCYETIIIVKLVIQLYKKVEGKNIFPLRTNTYHIRGQIFFFIFIEELKKNYKVYPNSFHTDTKS